MNCLRNFAFDWTAEKLPADLRKPLKCYMLFLALFLLTTVMPPTAWGGNPVPFIDQVTPLSVMPGNGDFTLTVTGAQFAAGAVVNWTTGTTITSLATTVISHAQLTATVPASLTAVPGTHSITVSNPATGAPPSNVAFFEVTAPLGSLPLASTNIPVGEMSSEFNRAVSVADLNGDGNLDLAVGNPGAESVSILLGNGDGTFTSAPNVNVGDTPVSTAVGDFNDDGKLDLAVVDFDGSVYTMLGNGDGTFQPPVSVPILDCCPRWVSTADTNHNGKLDLVVALYWYGLVILPGNGDGTFTSPGQKLYFGGGPTSIAMADVNHDGILDIVLSAEFHEVAVLLGNATGSFAHPTYYQAPAHPGNVSLADFNGDGNMDIVVADFDNERVWFYRGNGDGTFMINSKVVLPYGYFNPFATAVGNFDGDQMQDIVVANYSANSAAILRGNGDFTFNAGTPVVTGIGPVFVAVGDFNNDGALDFVTGQELDNNITVVLQQLP